MPAQTRFTKFKEWKRQVEDCDARALVEQLVKDAAQGADTTGKAQPAGGAGIGQDPDGAWSLLSRIELGDGA